MYMHMYVIYVRTYVRTHVGVCTMLSLFLSRQKTEREAEHSGRELEEKLHVQENMVRM